MESTHLNRVSLLFKCLGVERVVRIIHDEPNDPAFPRNHNAGQIVGSKS